VINDVFLKREDVCQSTLIEGRRPVMRDD
jgi:hypothetical protein